jgi:hypothetical protein
MFAKIKYVTPINEEICEEGIIGRYSFIAPKPRKLDDKYTISTNLHCDYTKTLNMMEL